MQLHKIIEIHLFEYDVQCIEMVPCWVIKEISLQVPFFFVSISSQNIFIFEYLYFKADNQPKLCALIVK